MKLDLSFCLGLLLWHSPFGDTFFLIFFTLYSNTHKFQQISHILQVHKETMEIVKKNALMERVPHILNHLSSPAVSHTSLYLIEILLSMQCFTLQYNKITIQER